MKIRRTSLLYRYATHRMRDAPAPETACGVLGRAALFTGAYTVFALVMFFVLAIFGTFVLNGPLMFEGPRVTQNGFLEAFAGACAAAVILAAFWLLHLICRRIEIE
jgi:hypothetical protein